MTKCNCHIKNFVGREDFTSSTNGFRVDGSMFTFINISFTANNTRATLNISVIDDNLFETDENFVLRIDHNALNFGLSELELGETTLTIIDNDGELIVQCTQVPIHKRTIVYLNV